MEPSKQKITCIQTKEAIVKKQDPRSRCDFSESGTKGTESQYVCFKANQIAASDSRSSSYYERTNRDVCHWESNGRSKRHWRVNRLSRPLGERWIGSPQVLQGFVIQVAFGEMRDARRWAETLGTAGICGFPDRSG